MLFEMRGAHMGVWVDMPDENGMREVRIGCGCNGTAANCDHKTKKFEVHESQLFELSAIMESLRD